MTTLDNQKDGTYRDRETGETFIQDKDGGLCSLSSKKIYYKDLWSDKLIDSETKEVVYPNHNGDYEGAGK